MKTKLFKVIAIVAAISAAALFTTSCDAINEATETEIEVGDFNFTINTNLVAQAEATGTRAEGDGAHFAGSYTISREELLGNIDAFAYNLIRDVSIGNVIIEVKQQLDDITIENLTLACDGLTSLVVTDTPLNEIGSTQNEALKTLASGIVMKVIRDGEATVSIDATLDKAVSEETVSYLIGLSDITVTAGLNL